MKLITPAFSEFVVGALFFIPAILFLLTQHKVLKLIEPQNRSISPGEVFLQLVPLFGMIWQFFVVIRISDSIRKELGERMFSFEGSPAPGNVQDKRPTYRTGITYCILFCCYLIPFIGSIAFMAGTVCWIIYWVKLWRYKKKLEQKRYLPSSPPWQP